MTCGAFCNCCICLELNGCESKISTKSKHSSSVISDNFILATKNNNGRHNAKKLTYFGMEDNLLVKETPIKPTMNSYKLFSGSLKDKKHKSVIYVNDVNDCSGEKSESQISIKEQIDSELCLDSVENSRIITVVFQNTYSFASQIINEVQNTKIKDEFSSPNSSLDDFPLGIEAHLLNAYLGKKRFSYNSKGGNYPVDPSEAGGCSKEFASLYHPGKISTFTPANITVGSPAGERMVSPKRKVDHFQHLYIANNVKTSSFSEQIEKTDVQNMVPERDTGPTNTDLPKHHQIANVVSSVALKPPGVGRITDNRVIINTSKQPQHNHNIGSHHQNIKHHRLSSPHINHNNNNNNNNNNINNNNSSSDENRSSGHASMSDTGNSSPQINETERVSHNKAIRSRMYPQCGRARHRATPAKLHVPWTGSGGLEDIKQALQQLTMSSHTSTSTYSSASAGSESSEPVLRRLMRHSSLETVNTNITNADEFIWVDSYNRLVELQTLPWTNHCLLHVLQAGRLKEHMSRVSIETIPRLSYLLQRALVRLSRETQRFGSTLAICTKNEIVSAFRVVLCPPLSDSCVKASLRAAAMLAMSENCTSWKQSKSQRAGLQLHVGRFHRWMVDVKLAKFVHEYAAVYLCAGIENLLEEILLQCLPSDGDVTLTATLLEHAIANNGDLWGLLQPYAHLNAGRIASGALALPRWALSGPNSSTTSSIESSLMTTCVGSLNELQDVINAIQPKIAFCSKAVRSLFYFMRCSQLEHGEQDAAAIQELCYERAYVVLPPVVEWLRVATAHGEHRYAAFIDKDDVMQAARLLLPGVDCPIRALGEEAVRIKKNHGNEEDQIEATSQIQIELAFRLLLTGRSELIQKAIPLLPANSGLDTVNSQGHTVLMLSAIYNDDSTLVALLDAGASVDAETPAPGNQYCPSVNNETQYWTALTYAAAKGHTKCVRILLERGANVEGGALLSEEKFTLTPLQVSCGSGNLEIVSLLLAHGAHPFFSTQIKDALCYSVSAQRGCYSAISVAASHGQRAIMQKLLSQPATSIAKEVLSLEEMLAEGCPSGTTQSVQTPFSKSQLRTLQEAMYHSAENNHLDITVEIRTLGVPWTLHCWMHSLAAAHEVRLDCVVDQLLQDFLQVCPDDYSSHFIQECLPLLFNIFRYSKKEGTTLLLADIFSTCYGWEPIKSIEETVPSVANGSRIDPKYVNNPELSDVTFRVEGRLFYAHKIVLVTASTRLRAMLSSKLMNESGVPTVQINDIRYHIFQIVMQYLYHGGCQALDPISSNDILELMAAANFFQLDGLLRYCETRCAAVLALDNVVSMYIHAKVYNAIQLLQYCQGFLLQNMVALLTYDDSVKRLLFAKKLPNHDVLSGLLATLQNRIQSRKHHKSMQSNSSLNVSK